MVKRVIRKFDKSHFRVTLFGSARIEKDSREWKDVYRLSAMVARRKMDIVTGGGPGLMKAASAGHKSVPSKKRGDAVTIGLGIKLPNEQGQNRFVEIKRNYNRFSTRLDNFMLLSNVIVVAHGGVGTLLEMLYAWQLIQVKHTCNIPIILLGEQWKGLLKWLESEPLKRGFFDESDMRMIFHAKNCSEAIKMIDTAHKEFKSGNENFCLNYDKYKLY